MALNLTIGFSPCPNDTFILGALLNGFIESEITFNPIIRDIEELNFLAIDTSLDIIKISYANYPKISNQYMILDSGSALGKGVGPILIKRKHQFIEKKKVPSIAVPGINSTAFFLLKYYFKSPFTPVVFRFDKIEEAVLNNQVDMGLIIHENRFTYQQKELEKVIDLGDFWEKATNRIIPLGGFVIKRSIEKKYIKKIDTLIKKSIEFAYFNTAKLMPYIIQHAQEMEQVIIKQHIDLYVNNYSKSLGSTGEEAILFFIKTSAQGQVLRHPLFAKDRYN